MSEQVLRKPSIAICVPAHDHSPTLWAYDFGRLMLRIGSVLTDKFDGVALYVQTGTYVHRARQDLADAALANGADYILWIDSDMRLPGDALERLLAHGEDIVGVNYSNRGVPPGFTAVRSTGLDGEGMEKLTTGPDSTGLVEVEGMGFGCVLTSARVFAALERPWFDFQYLEDTGEQIGEDVYFLRKAKNAGFKAYVDQDLSKEIGHIGTIEYLTDHALAMQDRKVPA